MTTAFRATIAGIHFGFYADFPMDIPAELLSFPYRGGKEDEAFRISIIRRPLSFQESPVFSSPRLNVYRTAEGTVREFTALQSLDGCRAVCLLRDSGQNSIFLPQKDLERYQSNCMLSVLLGAEAIFLRHDCLLLHSSVISYEGKAILFCGASGSGKSTQAALWKSVLGAEIINGDRCVISRRQDGYYGCGSPYCGSSGIMSNREAPIHALLLPVKAEDTTLRRVSAAEAFRRIFRELTVNTWDSAFMEHALSLLTEFTALIPVYELRCRPNADAVRLTKEEIMG